MKEKLTKDVSKGTLSNVLVDQFSDYTAKALENSKLSSKDVLRFRISVETAMGAWMEKIGEGAECTFEVTRKFGRVTIKITCEGEKCNPQSDNVEEYGNLANSSLLQSLGLSGGYKYENGVNSITFMPPTGFAMQIAPIILAFVFGIGIALLLKTAAPEPAVFINDKIIDPIFSAFMGLLRAIAGPLVFLSVLSGIYGIGDISSLGKIGRKMIGRFVAMTYVTLAITLVILLPLTNTDVGKFKFNSDTLNEAIELILQFVPTDIISPFLNGNMLQIIALAVACGIVILVLGEAVSEFTRIVSQIFAIVQLMMEAIGKLIPFFVFVSMLSLVLSNTEVGVSYFIKPILAVIGGFVGLCLIYYPIVLKIKYRMGFMNLMKKCLPTFLIALSTASSVAAFSTNVETCERELGISKNIVMFGVPLGQVVYMPIAAAEYIAISMVLADSFDVQITPMWIITAVFVCGILAIATPPIPGGTLTIFSVLFVQLGIPDVALPIAIGIDMIADYLATSGDIMALQEDMIICADKTNLLDKKILTANKR